MPRLYFDEIKANLKKSSPLLLHFKDAFYTGKLLTKRVCEKKKKKKTENQMINSLLSTPDGATLIFFLFLIFLTHLYSVYLDLEGKGYN